ncbi:sensor domain-containing diguanylate cyclase [Desulfitobacterium hafniense]|nr:GGDEF domain-containing protein [Desulfitobacterium hafniense]ACL20485.1 diguanylate cyclase [Desulfitobacterium hafniense DCB-2]EHL04320.1 diguanylate cyclase domain protein [Desulfitobacterium hafniense DP7]KTE92369.1 diguanylate cyclase [Desulfitobacterium hafniense]MEA5025982.1 GGDEF domain-containing protein [Desulfitobacterium hafniense]CDX01338.1 Diguanylate cyclase domain protein [Desulfitobacterium hafniense]
MLNGNISPHLFRVVFENSPIGLVVVNEDTSLKRINNYMLATFNIDPQDFHERMLGNAFQCSDIYLTGKSCGEGGHCHDCGLRKVLSTAMLEGANILETVVEHDFIIDGTNRKKWFKVSASRVETDDEVLGILSFVDITTQMEYEELLKNLLSLDAATGAMNKYALINSLKNLTTGKEGLTVAMIDIDDFKLVNDRYGHLTGDRVLNLFCSVAFTNTRKQDIVGRFGGEEFMLIFPDMVSRLVIKALQRISTSFRTACMNELGFSPTFSVGVAEFSTKKMAGMTIDAIIAEADENLYASKNAGKNRVTAFGSSQVFK